MTQDTKYEVSHDALQRLADSVGQPGAMPTIQRDWILSWINTNITPVNPEPPEPNSDQERAPTDVA